MLSELNAIQRKTGPSSGSSLQFLIEPEPWVRIFLRNIADCFRPAPPQVWLTAKPGEYWADAPVHRPAAWGAFGDSFMGHILVVAVIFGLTVLWLNQPHVVPDEITQLRHIENYQVSDYLPPVKQNDEKPEPPRRRVAQKADPAYAPQEIISVHVDHQSTTQTIVNPVSPKLLSQDTPLPNIVIWTPVPAAPMASNHPLQQLPLNTPPVVPPAEETTQRKLNALEFPVQPQVVAPPETPVNRNLSAVQLPVEPQAAVPPSQSATQRRLGDINLAVNAPSVEAPKVPVPEQQATNGSKPAESGKAQTPVPPVEPVAQGTAKAQAKEMGQLLVANVQPVTPAGPVTVPEGNRQGEFAAGPTGHPGASGKPEIVAGGESSGANRDGNSLPSKVFVSAPPAKVAPGVVVSAPPSPPKRDVPTAGTAHETSGRERIDNQVFGDRKSYSMALNMPNFASATGSSWIIHFAEMNPVPGAPGGGLSAPVPVHKVDPAYPPALMRDRVEGTVILYAIIHSDGSVGEVKILQGVDTTLDANARDALQKWEFRPGTKDGAPVDLEAVIRIPFRAPTKIY